MHVRGASSPALGLLGGLLFACTSVAAPSAPPELRVRSADGLSLAYEEAGSGEPALVFVHGWCCDRGFWRTTLEAFAPTHRVLALDLGGHGASGAERERWTLESLADDVVAAVEALDARTVVLIGHSMGAPVALLAAPRLGGRVQGVIGVESLHDVAFRYPPGYLEQAVGELEADFPRALEASFRAALAPEAPAGLREWICARALRTDRRAALELLRGLDGVELSPVLAAAGVPVRVINAAPRAPDGLATNVEGNARLADFQAELLDGVGHFPMLEQPARFQAALRRALESLAQGARKD